LATEIWSKTRWNEAPVGVDEDWTESMVGDERKREESWRLRLVAMGEMKE